MSSNSSQPTANSPESVPSRPYKPDPLDVLCVKRLLTLASASRLPIDLTDDILDHAGYWPRVVTRTTRILTARGSSHIEDLFILRSPPLCPEAAEWNTEGGAPPDPAPPLHAKHPVREIVWTLRSHDQGWSGEAPTTRGTYSPSYTWFDVELERFHPGSSGDGDDGATERALSNTGPDRECSARAMLDAWPGQRSPRLSRRSHPLTTPASPARTSRLLHPPSATAPSDQTTASSSEPSTTPPALASCPHYDILPLSSPEAFPPLSDGGEDYTLQRNVQAKKETTEHRVVWSWRDGIAEDDDAEARAQALVAVGRGADSADGRCARSMRRGDCLVLWARARYPAWVNQVEAAEVEVYFAI